MGNGADHVINSPSRRFPCDPAIFRAPPAEFRSQPRILGNPRGLPRLDERKALLEEAETLSGQLVIEGQGSILYVDRDPFLSNDVPCISFLDHGVERHARLALPVDQDPIDRRAPSILGQKRAMEIDAPKTGDVEKLFGKEPAVVKRKDEIRGELAHQLDKRRGIGIGRGIDRQFIVAGKRGHRAKPDIFVGIVAMRNHGHDLFAGFDQKFQTFITDVVIGKDGNPHFRQPSIVNVTNTNVRVFVIFTWFPTQTTLTLTLSLSGRGKG